MQYSEEHLVQKLMATGWTTVHECDTEKEALDSLNYSDDGTQSWRIIRTSELVWVTRMRAKR